MTIGWATLGLVWGEPVLTVFVRPSRFTAPLLEQARRFSVNVPIGRMQHELEFCGTHSGRDTAKIDRAGLATAEGVWGDLTILPGCDLIYECEIVQRLEFQPQAMPRELKGMFYGAGDYHRCYFGKVLRAQCQAPAGA
jgi:flavin reductase (DIM6/NTAB) family NADH-FMN oxidoreductase RutF